MIELIRSIKFEQLESIYVKHPMLLVICRVTHMRDIVGFQYAVARMSQHFFFC